MFGEHTTIGRSIHVCMSVALRRALLHSYMHTILIHHSVKYALLLSANIRPPHPHRTTSSASASFSRRSARRPTAGHRKRILRRVPLSSSIKGCCCVVGWKVVCRAGPRWRHGNAHMWVRMGLWTRCPSPGGGRRRGLSGVRIGVGVGGGGGDAHINAALRERSHGGTTAFLGGVRVASCAVHPRPLAVSVHVAAIAAVVLCSAAATVSTHRRPPAPLCPFRSSPPYISVRLITAVGVAVALRKGVRAVFRSRCCCCGAAVGIGVRVSGSMRGVAISVPILRVDGIAPHSIAAAKAAVLMIMAVIVVGLVVAILLLRPVDEALVMPLS